MSTTRTVPVSSSATYQKGQRQQNQEVSWKRSHLADDGIPVSKGYRLGGGGRERSEIASASAIAIINNLYKTEGEMDQNRNENRVGNGWRVGEAKENDVQGSDAKDKQPIEVFYAEKGVDFHRLRKETKVRFDTSGSKSKQKITMDFFNLPKGYTAEDLPDIRGQGLSESMEEQPISPAVLLASQCRREKRMDKELPKINCDELIESLKKRRQNQKERTSETNGQNEQASRNLGAEMETAMFDGSFPEDSFNESELVMASQQVEDEFAVTSSQADFRKRDINGNTKNVGKPLSVSKASHIPFTTSTPNPGRNRKSGDEETPKTRGFGLSRIRNKSSTQSNSSFFEKSASNIEISPVRAESEQMEAGTPRKVLRFEESPIKHLESSTFGDFWDDEDDDIFSQIVIPGEVQLPKTNVEQKENAPDEPTINNVTMDSFLNESELAAISKLEALNCRSASTSGDSNTSFISDKRNSRTTNSTKTNTALPTETPRSRSRRLGLSKHRNKKT